MTPETTTHSGLRKWADERFGREGAPFLFAFADAWKALEEKLALVVMARDLAEYQLEADIKKHYNEGYEAGTLTMSGQYHDEVESLGKWLSAAEKALRQIAAMTNEMSAHGQFTAGDAYYAQALAIAALKEAP